MKEHFVAIEGALEVTEFIPIQRIGVRESGFCEGTYAFTVEPEGTGSKLTVAGEYAHARVWPIPLLGTLWEWLILKGETSREIRIFPNRLKTKLEGTRKG